MPIQERDLTFESLEAMSDGRIAMLLKRHLQNVAADCMNRPHDKAKRKVVLEFIFVPVPDVDDMTVCDRVDMEIECKSKVPTFRTKVIQRAVAKLMNASRTAKAANHRHNHITYELALLGLLEAIDGLKPTTKASQS
ncbi:hypothetical protein [Rubinisphaera italica]|uniref:Uncharacterized protein n=1 Tax=Rubinisphaera italica TaxID=2527969 RepID=A0A5C5XL49_9PLAN|nr:hypothetical protein [Rubinisphaera italica]TWT63161.1 hypothetical protein Pan54_39140 [Rubinisphaera italica]